MNKSAFFALLDKFEKPDEGMTILNLYAEIHVQGKIKKEFLGSDEDLYWPPQQCLVLEQGQILDPYIRRMANKFNKWQKEYLAKGKKKCT